MKLTLTLCALILLITGGYYYNELTKRTALDQDTIYGEFSYPQGSYYEVDEDGDIIIELAKKQTVGKGTWPRKTRFYFDGAKLGKIEVPKAFTFAGLEFKFKAEFLVEEFPPNILYRLKVGKKIKIDGLDVHPECEIEFKNYVLYSAKCPEFGIVYFKRSLKLPVIEEVD